MAAGHDSVLINVLKVVILPLLPEEPLCWNLVFQYLQSFTERVVWLAFLVWFVSSQVIPKTEDRLGPDDQVETVAGCLAVAAVAMWAFCFFGKSYTETPAEKRERREREEKTAV